MSFQTDFLKPLLKPTTLATLALCALIATIQHSLKITEISTLKLSVHSMAMTIVYFGLLNYLRKFKIPYVLLVLLLVVDLFSRVAYEAALTVTIWMSLINAPLDEALSFLLEHYFLIILGFIVIACLISVRTQKLPVPLTKAIAVFSILYLFVPTPLSYPKLFQTPKYQTHINQSRAMRIPEYIIDYEHVVLDVAWRFPIVESVVGLLHTGSRLAASFYEKDPVQWSQVSQKEKASNLLVLVIGESMRADHLDLYGYNRPTTPKLRQLGQDLKVYKNAYSAGTSTWNSLPATLTLDSQETGNDLSIIRLAQAAGYKVHWLSNQLPYETWGITLTDIAKQSDVTMFTSKHELSQKIDSALLPYIDKTLANRKKTDKDLLIVHLYGSHPTFTDRYPDEFNIFKAEDYADGEPKTVPSYDNSILYTDYIFDELVSRLAPLKADLLFFADHGLTSTKSDIPLKHDVRLTANLDSLNVPLLATGPNKDSLPEQEAYALYHFPCFFSAWSGISASQLSNTESCAEAFNTDTIRYLGPDLAVRHAAAPK